MVDALKQCSLAQDHSLNSINARKTEQRYNSDTPLRTSNRLNASYGLLMGGTNMRLLIFSTVSGLNQVRGGVANCTCKFALAAW